MVTGPGDRAPARRAGARAARPSLAAAPGAAPRAHAPSPVPVSRSRCGEPGGYLLDPNRRSPGPGWLRTWRAKLGGDTAKIDPQIAFLTLGRDVRTPFARTLRVPALGPVE